MPYLGLIAQHNVSIRQEPFQGILMTPAPPGKYDTETNSGADLQEETLIRPSDFVPGQTREELSQNLSASTEKPTRGSFLNERTFQKPDKYGSSYVERLRIRSDLPEQIPEKGMETVLNESGNLNRKPGGKDIIEKMEVKKTPDAPVQEFQTGKKLDFPQKENTPNRPAVEKIFQKETAQKSFAAEFPMMPPKPPEASVIPSPTRKQLTIGKITVEVIPPVPAVKSQDRVITRIIHQVGGRGTTGFSSALRFGLGQL